MQGWQNLLTQISIGVLVNAIIGILCWLLKREFLFFKRKMRIPRSLQMLPRRKNSLIFPHSFNSSLFLATTPNPIVFIPNPDD